MDSQPISASQFVDLLPTPPQVSLAGKTFALYVFDAPLHSTTTFADHALGLHISGTHRLRQQVGRRVSEGRSDPGVVNFLPAHLTLTVDSSAPARIMVLFLSEAFLSRVIEEHWDIDPRNVEVFWQPIKRDPVVESVMTGLALDAQTGSPSGQLYAESGCDFLAHHIIHSYSSLSTPAPPSSGGLPGGRLKVVIDYIDANLAQPISLRQLARLADVSARHFERAFCQAVGVPPHTYVLQRRVAVARELLLTQPALSIEQIAASVGFSSSSHLASMFRREFGCSPTTFRRLQSP
jgi:AraC family transcriptional regulator